MRKVIDFLRKFKEDESAVGVVELILILVVLIGLVVIFRDQLTTIIGTIFERIASDSAAI
ncbi:MAG: Flp1 family type IVb pilin [Lachnospiraceae bacterium]|jgi:Flp pilus assembly pilin Flp|nr:holin, BlyA family protein [Lachnospiraceae bacterium]MCI6665123.1 holin, BlyA family protein [Lachnospiraceae bacterium]MDD6580157.1 Flp1 family type IVb pilin [Lachnospiraceae bacterium]MDD7223166.1 Flp1 family type IVb pilin [Lachnospiraceae bacterium]MDO4508865.1 Flp1 family type IVb pilin [Lachnospiraceae bacterium]